VAATRATPGGRARDGGAAEPGMGCRERDDECRDLLGRRFPPYDLQEWLGGLFARGISEVFCHSGMFPCFFGGRVLRFSRSARSAFTTCARVSDGLMTAST
jgi:hypothetical protein